MFIKLGILAACIVVGGLIFANEVDMFLPTTSATLTDSLKTDVANLGNNATVAVEKRMEESVGDVLDETTSIASNQITKMGEKISIELAEVRESTKQVMNTLYDTLSNTITGIHLWIQ